jgi:hypothetical protein
MVLSWMNGTGVSASSAPMKLPAMTLRRAGELARRWPGW